MIKLPKKIFKMIKALENAGYSAYAVGGSVRDLLLGKEVSDWDIATNASLEEMFTVFPECEVVSEEYWVIRLKKLHVDIATFRSEEYRKGEYGKPSVFSFLTDIKEDLKRRDFTINAMAFNPSRGIVDIYGGKDDLKKRILKTVGEPNLRFTEDPFRILRGIRFAAEKALTIEADTFKAMKAKAPLLQYISVDKAREEILKIIRGENSQMGINFLFQTGVADIDWDLGKKVEEILFHDKRS